jgi:hypothetical protein
MTALRRLFDQNSLLMARRVSVRDARAQRPGGPERNQQRQIARSLKRLIESQLQVQHKVRRPITHEIHDGRMIAKPAG